VHQCARNHFGISRERRKARFRRAQIRREKSFPDREISGKSEATQLLRFYLWSSIHHCRSHRMLACHLFARFFQTHNGGAGSKRRCARLRAIWRELRAPRQKERSARFGPSPHFHPYTLGRLVHLSVARAPVIFLRPAPSCPSRSTRAARLSTRAISREHAIQRRPNRSVARRDGNGRPDTFSSSTPFGQIEPG